MALTQAEIDITLMSLGRIGNKTNLTTGNQTTDPVGIKAELFFDQTRDSLLRSFSWNFAETQFYMSRTWATDTDFLDDQYAFAQYAAYAIATATVATKTFTITSTVDISDYFSTDSTITVYGSTGNANDGDYTVSSATYAYPTLLVVVDETIASGVLADNGSVSVDWTTGLQYKCNTNHTSDDFLHDFDAGKWTKTTDAPLFKYTYWYDLPSDSLFFAGTNLHRFAIESTKLLTNETDIKIIYIKQITDPDSWDALFKELFILRLALKLLPAIGGVSTPTLNAELMNELRIAEARAKVVDFQEDNDTGRNSWLGARFTGLRRPWDTSNWR